LDSRDYHKKAYFFINITGLCGFFNQCGGKRPGYNRARTFAGVPLSLDDTQFTILKQNYDNTPLVI
jgi:hypothetical protein